MKRVTTVIRQSPFNSLMTAEALRMSLGLTLADNEVKVVFVEEAVYLLEALATEEMGYPDLKRHVETLKEMGCELIAEKESLQERGLGGQSDLVDIRDRDEIHEIIQQSDRVISF